MAWQQHHGVSVPDGLLLITNFFHHNRALGCRLDSGDLSYLSQEVRKMTTEASKSFDRPFLATTNIMASNDINEESLQSLADQVGHVFFVGC